MQEIVHVLERNHSAGRSPLRQTVIVGRLDIVGRAALMTRELKLANRKTGSEKCTHKGQTEEWIALSSP